MSKLVLLIIAIILAAALFGTAAAVGVAKFGFGIIFFLALLIIGGIILFLLWIHSITEGVWWLCVIAMILTFLYVLGLLAIGKYWIVDGFVALIKSIPRLGVMK